MLKSKRFLAVIVAGVVFLVATLILHQEPIPFATAVMIIVAPYLAAETYSKSKTNGTT